eukprot:284329-Hanusia_phi.AAC.1
MEQRNCRSGEEEAAGASGYSKHGGTSCRMRRGARVPGSQRPERLHPRQRPIVASQLAESGRVGAAV